MILLLMSIDIQVNIYKYTNTKNRHISFCHNSCAVLRTIFDCCHNISSWLTTDHKIINAKTLNLIQKYKQYLRIDDIEILKKCTQYNIKVIPPVYKIKDFKKVVKYCIQTGNLYYLKFYKKKDYCQFLCDQVKKKRFDNVKFLHTNKLVDIDDFRYSVNRCIRIACTYSNFVLIKYFHKKVGLNLIDFEESLDDVFYMKCFYKNLECTKYLFEKVGIKKKILFINNGTILYKVAEKQKRFNIARYIHEIINITSDDINNLTYRKDMATATLPLLSACDGGNILYVKYLHETLKLIQPELHNFALYLAIKNSHFNIVKYLCETICIDKTHVECQLQYSWIFEDKNIYNYCKQIIL